MTIYYAHREKENNNSVGGKKSNKKIYTGI
jgi:hypothetical protein